MKFCDHTTWNEGKCIGSLVRFLRKHGGKAVAEVIYQTRAAMITPLNLRGGPARSFLKMCGKAGQYK